MKTAIICLALLLCCNRAGIAQSQSDPASQVIEGGKLIVELIKVIHQKKGEERERDCQDSYADLCINNQSNSSLVVSLLHRQSAEAREVVVLPGGRECALQARVGVWTYDLKVSGSPLSLRKGDLRIEGCKNIDMTINNK